LFDEWVSLPLAEALGMDDYGGNKGGLLTGMQSKQNN